MEENKVYQVIQDLIQKKEDIIKSANSNIERVSELDKNIIIDTKEKIVSVLDDTIDKLKIANDNGDEKLEEMIDVFRVKSNTATELAKKKFENFKDNNDFGKDFDKFINEESDVLPDNIVPVSEHNNLDKVIKGFKKTIKVTKKETEKTGKKINEFLKKPEVKDYEKKTKKFIVNISKNVKNKFSDLKKRLVKGESSLDDELEKSTNEILQDLDKSVDNIKHNVDDIKND